MLTLLVLLMVAVAIGPDLRAEPRREERGGRSGFGSVGLVRRCGSGRVRRRQRRELIADLPETLELVARSLRGGSNLRGALAEVSVHDSAAARSLRTVSRRVDAGDRLGVALDVWAAGLGDADADLARAVLRLGDDAGAAVAGSLEQAAASLRDRAGLRSEIVALSSQSRLSAVVVGMAPLAFLGVSVVADPDSATLLVTTEFGVLCLFLGLALDATGVLWMRRIGQSIAR